jgi:hypothetical protein
MRVMTFALPDHDPVVPPPVAVRSDFGHSELAPETRGFSHRGYRALPTSATILKPASAWRSKVRTGKSDTGASDTSVAAASRRNLADEHKRQCRT